MNLMKILIMAGGVGTRLWPMSTKAQPKQFQKLIGDRTLFQMSIARLRPAFRCKDIFVATNEAYKNLAKEQAPKIPKQNIILEPAKRDTAPCIALAVTKVALHDPEATLAILLSDHVIQKRRNLINVLKRAEQFLRQYPEYLVTLGIKPTYPATGYGYIKISNLKSSTSARSYGGSTEALGEGGQISKLNVYEVESFKEKPDLKIARKYIRSKKYFWNSGMFIWKVQTILNQFKKLQPAIYKRLLKIQRSLGTRKEREVIRKEYPKMKKISIDYGIMEKARKVACIPVDLGWSDIGDWAALKDILSEEKVNLVKGKHFGISTVGSLIYGPKDKLIATTGLKNFIIIVTDKSVLVCPKERAQEVKKLVEKLEKREEKKFL